VRDLRTRALRSIHKTEAGSYKLCSFVAGSFHTGVRESRLPYIARFV
jgi:hypothetical protein